MPEVPAGTICNSCAHEAPEDEMIPELRFNWTPTGNRVCRDGDACFSRWVAKGTADTATEAQAT